MLPKVGPGLVHPENASDLRGTEPELVVHDVMKLFVEQADPLEDVCAHEYGGLRDRVDPVQQLRQVERPGTNRSDYGPGLVDDSGIAIDDTHLRVQR